MNLMRGLVVLGLLAAGAVHYSPGAEARPGLHCDFAGDRLEGECYTKAFHRYAGPYGCNPGRDGQGNFEYVEVVDEPAFSGGKGLRLPGDECGALFQNLTVPTGRVFRGLAGRISDYPGDVLRFSVHITGGGETFVAICAWRSGPTTQTCVFDPATPTSFASDWIFLEYFISSGCCDADLLLDYLVFGDPAPPREETHAYMAGIGDVGCLNAKVNGRATGCLTITARPGEELVHLMLEDDLSPKVGGAVCSPDCFTYSEEFCGSVVLRNIPAGQPIRVYISEALGPTQCGAAALGVGTTGVLRAAYWRL